MQQKTKHNLAFLLVFTLAFLSGKYMYKYNQSVGLYIGVFLTGFAYLMLVELFPREKEVKQDGTDDYRKGFLEGVRYMKEKIDKIFKKQFGGLQ
jgi:hypothetical protein